MALRTTYLRLCATAPIPLFGQREVDRGADVERPGVKQRGHRVLLLHVAGSTRGRRTSASS